MSDYNCDCIARVDADPKMVAANTRILLDAFGPPRAFVMTAKRDAKKRGKPNYLAATFCPFCGGEYPETPRRFVADGDAQAVGAEGALR